MKLHIPGYLLFQCECGWKWQKSTTNCRNLIDCVFCPECALDPQANYELIYTQPYDYEMHPEWGVDNNGKVVVK